VRGRVLGRGVFKVPEVVGGGTGKVWRGVVVPWWMLWRVP
jgi:hypothetical protein